MALLTAYIAKEKMDKRSIDKDPGKVAEFILLNQEAAIIVMLDNEGNPFLVISNDLEYCSDKEFEINLQDEISKLEWEGVEW